METIPQVRFAQVLQLCNIRVVKISAAATRVARRLLEGGPATAAQLATDLNLTSTAIRRQLEALESRGFVTMHDEAPFGPLSQERRGRGRPAKVFALTSPGRDAFEQVYDDVAIEALRFMAARDDRSLVAEFAQKRAESTASRYAQALTAESVEDRATELATMLSIDGFAASTQVSPAGALQLCEHHCPMSHVAAEFPEFCEAEQAAISRLLGVHTVRISTIASGSDICTTHIPVRNSRIHEEVSA